MGTFKSIEEIEAWQLARSLTKEIYFVTGRGTFARDFGLKDQIRRASVSIMSNIAEGFERSGNREFVQFLSLAKGSAGEVKSQLYVALDQGYLSQDLFDSLVRTVDDTGKMIAGLMNYLRSSKFKGTKFK